MKPKRVSKPALLRSATAYPWKRNHRGDLCGANGRPIYFSGADAVLVEHSPEMAEALVMIRALSEGRRDSQRALTRIHEVAAHTVAELEKSNSKPSWCLGSIG